MQSRDAANLDLRPLALARIAIGALILVWTTPLLAPLHISFVGGVAPMQGWPTPGFSFAWLPADAIRALCVVRTVGALGLMLGLFCAPLGVLTCLSGYLVDAQSGFTMAACSQLLYEAAALLGLSDAGAVLALRPTPLRSPGSSYWMLRLFVASIYSWAGAFKLRPDWLDGSTLQFLHRPGIIRGVLADWLLATPASCTGVAHAVALFELSAAPLLLWPKTRRVGLSLAYVFHLGLEITAHPDLFGWAMMALLLVFVARDQEPAAVWVAEPTATNHPGRPVASPRICSEGAGQRSSLSRPVEAGVVGETSTLSPDITQPRWLGANRGARYPSLISRVTANRL